MTSAIIVGDPGDGHVLAVVQAVADLGGPSPFIVDAAALSRKPFCVLDDHLTLDGSSIELNGCTNGWLRRHAPSAWGAGTVSGSLDAARLRAFMSVIGSIARASGPVWLTPLDKMLRAEDRLEQLAVARAMGFRVPKTIVTSSGSQAADHLGLPFVVKPMVNGYYRTDDGPRAVFTTALTATDLDEVDFAAAPFVAQEQITPIEHLRVVTVGDRAWTASLSAADRPLDWRRQPEAHFEWREAADDQVIRCALRLSGALGIGFSSQDWLRDDDGLIFIDLNPGGQWLFLPPEVSDPATRSIAKYLVEGDPDG